MKDQTLRNFQWSLKKFGIKYFISTRFLGYPFEVKTYLKSFRKAKLVQPKHKVVIFSSGRSGSTLLVELLNCYPSIFCDSELLKRKLNNPFGLISAKAQQCDKDIYGFKLLSYQLRDIQTSVKDKRAFITRLVNDGYKLIYLNRENKLLLSLSTLLAMSKEKWHTTKSNSASSNTISIDVKALLEMIKEVEDLTRFEKDMLKGIDHLSLSYESDLFEQYSRERSMKKIGDFLDVDYVQPETKLKKLNQGHFSDIISNWNEVLDSLENSKYAHYIESEIMR